MAKRFRGLGPVVERNDPSRRTGKQNCIARDPGGRRSQLAVTLSGSINCGGNYTAGVVFNWARDYKLESPRDSAGKPEPVKSRKKDGFFQQERSPRPQL